MEHPVSILITLAAVLLLFGLTIFIHELGHFLVARWCGMQIDAFSIGFGPAIWKRTVNGVVYRIGVLPLGGYVALPQMYPTGEADGKGEDKPERKQPWIAPWKRILVGFAGVTGNFVLAVIVAHIVYWGGQSYAPPHGRLVVGYVETNAPVAATGIAIGDVIESVNGKPIGSWEEFVLAVALGETVVAKVRGPDGAVRDLTFPTAELMGSRYVPGLAPENYCYVLSVGRGSSAAAAGLKSGDRIVSFNDLTLYSREHLMDLVAAHANIEVPMTFERAGAIVETKVTPVFDESVGRARIGVTFNQLDVKKPWAQIESHATLIFKLLRALVTPGEAKAAAGAVGGPVAIFDMFWRFVQGGFIMALWFTCLLNVNLAVLNLLPMPVLDGGHILLALWEGIARRPVSPRIVGRIWNVFIVLLIGLFLLLTWRDVQRMVGFRRAVASESAAAANQVPAEAEPAPAATP